MDAHHLAPVEPNAAVKPFRSGDTVRVAWRVKEGERERVQQFQGVVIRVQGAGPGASFTVRRIAANIGIERSFPFASPYLEGVEVLRSGDVRRSRLYYQRDRIGKHARIKEKTRAVTVKGAEAEAEAAAAQPVAETAAQPQAQPEAGPSGS